MFNWEKIKPKTYEARTKCFRYFIKPSEEDLTLYNWFCYVEGLIKDGGAFIDSDGLYSLKECKQSAERDYSDRVSQAMKMNKEK